VLRDARAVLFTCEEERRLARDSFWLYRSRERVVTNGTATPSGDVKAQRDALFDRFPELTGKRILLFLGRIHKIKGCDILINAFASVAQRDEQLHLVMAGPDQTGWQQELMALARELGVESRITWPGMLAGDLKWGAFHAAEIFLLPSHHENFGIVVAEALACGVPVLISNQVNIWREIIQDSAGIVADDSTEGTTEGLTRWLDMSETEKSVLRERAKNCFESRFEISAAAESLLQVIAG